METEQQSVRSWITDGIIIAGLTATAYLWTLFYEVGFCGYFSIPYYFISLSPVNVLIIGGRFLLVFIVLCIPIILFGALRPFIGYLSALTSRFAIRSGVNSAIVMFFFSLMLSGMMVYFSSFEREFWLQILMRIIAVVPVIAFFTVPLVRQRNEKVSYWTKIILDWAPRQRISRPAPIPAPGFRDFVNLMLIAMFVVLIGIGNNIFPKAGKEDAQSKKEFQVISQSSSLPEVVVLRVYGDYLFAAPFDRSTKKVEKKLFILKISEIANAPLTTEQVGPLQVKP
jgi:hypothetical protein